MARVYQGERVALERVLGPVERLTYRAAAHRSRRGSRTGRPTRRATLVFSALFWVALYVILRTQGIHPFNPEGFDSAHLGRDLQHRRRRSSRNTNWQFYGGETTLSYFSQMAGLAVQNFVSAAVGMAVLAAVIRGFASRGAQELGNFWQDLTRTLLYILLPLSFVGALVLVSQGVVQTPRAATSTYATVQGVDQTLALGPAASQIAIKQLGHQRRRLLQREQRDAVRERDGVLELRRGALHPADPGGADRDVRAHGRQPPPGLGALRARWPRCSWPAIAVAYAAEQNGSPAQKRRRGRGAGDGTTGGNLEGKEQRFGIANSALWATATTAASNGSVNSAHDSYTGHRRQPCRSSNMMTGEVIFGGVGSGLYGMLLFVLLAVFIAGLMVGRTPEYLGKKVEAREVKLVLIGTLVRAARGARGHRARDRHEVRRALDLQLGPAGVLRDALRLHLAEATTTARRSPATPASSSRTRPATSGAFGITFADLLGGVAMLVGRFVPLLAALAVAGSLADEARRARRRRDLPDRHARRSCVLLVAVIVIVAALTFFPALLLGPIVQGLTPQLF